MAKLYGRTRARCQVVELLYQAELSGQDARDLIANNSYMLTKGPLHEYAQPLLAQYYEHQDRIDQLIEAHLTGWNIARLYAVDRALLRMSVGEMLAEDPEANVCVVIDEAVEIAKQYGQDGSPRFINGVLGSIARELFTELDAHELPQVSVDKVCVDEMPVVDRNDTIVWPNDDDHAFEVWEQS